MLKSTITITPADNVNHNQGCLIDKTKVETKTFDSLMDIFTFDNIISGERRKSNLIGVSLYDDLILNEDGSRSKILHMLTKGD